MQKTSQLQSRRAGGVSRLLGRVTKTRALSSGNSRFTPGARRAFTLVELMVVIALIAFLAGMLGIAISRMGTAAKEAATNALIKKIHAQLEQRLEAFDRQIGLIENSPRVDPDYRNAQRAVANTYPSVSSEQLRILVRKELIRANFPQTYAEVGMTVPTNHTAVTESAEILYHMLTNMKVGESPTVDAGEFLASEVADTDGDGNLEFIDGWGNPLRFYRWPTRLFKSNGTAHVEATDHPNVILLITGFNDDLVDNDPDDPLELILPVPPPGASPDVIAAWTQNGTRFENAYHTANTFFAPLIVSAGPDGLLGLREPHEKDTNNNNYGYLAQPDPSLTSAELAGVLSDNITNRNQRAGD